MASGILAIFPPNSEGAKTVLLHLAWRAGSDPAKDNYRSSYQKQKNSAEQIGCSRETYSRRVEYLRKLGILRTQPHTPGRPLLDTKIVEYTELRNIAERFGKHGAPPMKNDNSFSRSRLSRDNRVTRGSHRQPSDAGITHRGDAGITRTSDAGITPEPKKEPLQENRINYWETQGEGLHSSNGAEPRPAAAPQMTLAQREDPSQYDPGEIWDQVLHQLSSMLPETTFETWVRDTNGERIDTEAGELVISAPHVYAREWLNNRLVKKVKKVLSQVADGNLRPVFVVRNDQTQAPAPVQPRTRERSAFEQAREECLDFEALLLLPQYLPELLATD